MKKYFHNYKGIVIQNDDPEQMGRCKVWVPELSMTLYDKWNNDRNNDKMFTRLGSNLNSSLTPELLQRLRIALPWAIVKQPIFGMGSPVFYNADKDFSEIANDANSSPQQTTINEMPGSSSPQNNPTSPLAKALAPVAQQSTSAAKNGSSAAAVNANNNPSTTNSDLSYVNNASNSSVPKAIPVTDSSSPATSSTSKDNINHVVIQFNPNSRNAANVGRTFTSSATISTSSGTSISASSNATNARGPITTDVSGNVPSAIPVAPPTQYSAPLSYIPLATASISTPIVQANLASSINVSFVPNARNAANAGRTFTTSASIITSNGSSLSLNSSAVGAQAQFSVDVADITGIGVVYQDAMDAIDLASERLGDLVNLFSQYLYIEPSFDLIMPPMTVPADPYNRGGSGSDLFSLTYSELLPVGSMTNSLIGGINPSNKSGINYKKNLPANVDPNYTMGSNQQTMADSLPPIRGVSQGNKVKGMISIPGVGSHVSVYFDNGNPLYPIIDGFFYSQEDFRGLHDTATT